MSKNFVPAAIVALTALAATAGSALAHEAIIDRQGFDTALASVESQSSGTSGAQANAQGQAQAASQAVKVSGTHSPNVFADAYPGASSGNYTWWKDR